MGGQGRRSAARQREKAAGAENVAEKAKPKSYKSALALFCSSALLADAKKKATKTTPLASAVKKRSKTSAVLDDAKKMPKAPLAGAVFDRTKFTPAQHFAGPQQGCVFKLGLLGLGYYPDAPATVGKRPKTLSASAVLDRPTKKKLAPSPFTSVGPVQAFSELSISVASKRAISEVLRFVECTEVQSQTLPLALAGHDVIAKARTGSGKTLAFLLPTVERLAARAGTLPRGVHAIVLSPTRELAAQIQVQCAALIKHHRPLLSSHAVLGGTAVKLDVQRLRKAPPSVLVATPGRLLDLMLGHGLEKTFLSLQVLVLDEADQLLSLGFKKELAALLAALQPTAAARQTLLFSATLPEDVMSVAHVACRQGATKLVDAVGAGQLQTNLQVKQFVTVTSHGAQAAELLALLRELAAADHRPKPALTRP